jgi:magnesium-transporting ATPase (P-type)
MAPHGDEHGGHGGAPIDYTVDPKEREGLTTEQAEEAYKQWGFNELPVIEIPLWWVFLEQYMGTMPYMLELAIIIAGAVEDWIDFGIIIAMVSVLFNYLISFHPWPPRLMYSLFATAPLDLLRS